MSTLKALLYCVLALASTPRSLPSCRSASHVGMPLDLRGEPYCIVVAHPDDEIIWASSICENAEKVIICFSGSPEDRKIAEGRLALQAHFPLQNFVFLNIPEASFSGAPCILSVERESRVGLFGHKNEAEYADSFFQILACLRLHLRGCSCVFTHAPWGEYGHVDHVQVHKAVAEVCISYGLQLCFFSYLTHDTYSYMRQHLAARRSWDSFRMLTDRALYEKLKKIYQDHHCWTFDDDYVPPRYEGFLRLLPDPSRPGVVRTESRPLFLSLLWSVRWSRSERRFISVFQTPDSLWLRLAVLVDRFFLSMTLRYPRVFSRFFYCP